MIEELLKKVDRVELGWGWLWWSDTDQEWVVYNHGYRVHKAKVIYRGQSLEDALAALVKLVKVEEAQK